MQIVSTAAASATSTSATSTSATSAKPAAADAGSFQDALQEAGQAADAPPATPTAQTPVKPAVQADDKTPAAATAATLAATARPALAAAAKTQLADSKKPMAGADDEVLQPPQHGKETAVPAVAGIVVPVMVQTAPASAAPASSHTDADNTVIGGAATGAIDGKQAATAAPAPQPDAAMPATLPARQSAAPHVAAVSGAVTTRHDAAPAAAAPQANAIAAGVVLPQPATAPLVVTAASGAVQPSTAKAVPVRAGASGTVEIVSAASGSKPVLSVASVSDAAVLPVSDKQDDASDKQSPTATTALSAGASTPVAATTATAPPIAVAATASLPVTQPSAAGLAAAVTAMHQVGQSGAVLRLDPPGLGTLSVHVALTQSGQVNVLFIPSTQDAGAVLQNNLGGLGAALAQSGITLGQAQVGGQFHQNAGQGGYQPPTAQASAPQNYEVETAAPSGVSAYA